jgi:hypothetical protein
MSSTAIIGPGSGTFHKLHPCKRSPRSCLGPDHGVNISENYMLCHTRHVGVEFYDKEKQRSPDVRSWRGFLPRQPLSRKCTGGLRGPRSGAQELTCLNNIRCLPHSAQICYCETSYESLKLTKSFSSYRRASFFTISAQSHLLSSCTPPPTEAPKHVKHHPKDS